MSELVPNPNSGRETEQGRLERLLRRNWATVAALASLAIVVSVGYECFTPDAGATSPESLKPRVNATATTAEQAGPNDNPEPIVGDLNMTGEVETSRGKVDVKLLVIDQQYNNEPRFAERDGRKIGLALAEQLIRTKKDKESWGYDYEDVLTFFEPFLPPEEINRLRSLMPGTAEYEQLLSIGVGLENLGTIRGISIAKDPASGDVQGNLDQGITPIIIKGDSATPGKIVTIEFTLAGWGLEPVGSTSVWYPSTINNITVEITEPTGEEGLYESQPDI